MHMCAWHLCKLCNAIVQNPRVSLHPIFSSPSVCEALWSKHGHLLTHTNVNRRCLKRYVPYIARYGPLCAFCVLVYIRYLISGDVIPIVAKLQSQSVHAYTCWKHAIVVGCSHVPLSITTYKFGNMCQKTPSNGRTRPHVCTYMQEALDSCRTG